MIKRRKKLALVTVWLLTFTVSLAVLIPTYATSGIPSVLIDAKLVAYTTDLGYPFVDKNNRIQVPLRITLESFGAKVSWDSAHNTAIAEKGGVKIKIPIGTSYIIKDTTIIQNDTASLIREGRTYLPIRAVLEAFGAKVTYSAITQTIFVNKAGGEAFGDTASIHFLNVGQGDSTFIDIGSFEILIDAGTRAYGSQVVSSIDPYVDGNLEIVVATHAHDDHIGGLPAVFNAFQVDTIIDSGEVRTTLAYNNYYSAASSEANCNFITDADMSFDMGRGATYKILEMGDGYDNTNSNSIISLLDYGDVEVLFMADLDSGVEEAKINSFSAVDVVKIGHHGSKTSTSTLFLNQIKPKTAIISAGIDNPYHHPHSELLTRLLERKINVYGTFRSGDIVMKTDGSTYIIDAMRKLTMADFGSPAIN